MLGRQVHSGTFKTKESRAGLVRAPLFWYELLWNLRPSITYPVPCDQIVPRAYFMFVCFLCYCIPSYVKLCFLQIACNKVELSWIACQLVWTFSIELRISEALFCKLISSAHTRGHVLKQRQVPSCARKGRMMQEACAHEAKRLLVHF